MNKDEQIIATVSTLELAETIRSRILQHGRDVGPVLVVYVFFDSAVEGEYHIGVANAHHGKVSEDVIIDLMELVTDFQQEQLLEEASALGISHTDEDMDFSLPEGDPLDYLNEYENGPGLPRQFNNDDEM